MKCIYCQGQMEQGVAPFHISRRGYHLTLNEIPAWICRQCGEVYFDEAEVDAIQEVINAVDVKIERFAVAA